MPDTMPTGAQIPEDEMRRIEEKYTPNPVPPCRVCGEPLHCGQMGNGQAIYHCDSEAADSLRHKWGTPEEETARRHWSASEYITTARDWGDAGVLRAMEALRASQARVAELEGEKSEILGTITSAIHAAEVEWVDRYPGTDEPREFFVMLTRAEEKYLDLTPQTAP